MIAIPTREKDAMSGTDAGVPSAYLLRVVDGPDQGRQISLRSTAVVGRGDVDLVLTDPHVSRSHAQVSAHNGQVLLSDLRSSRGTWVGDIRIDGSRPLRPGDTFTVHPDTIMLLTEEEPQPQVLGPALQLVVREPGRPPRRHPLDGRPLRIGRDPQHCDIALAADGTVSAVHCEISPRAGQLVVVDLGSARGTCLNDEPVEEPTPLGVGDALTVGRTEITVVSSAGTPAISPPPLQLIVQEEGAPRPWAVTITAAPGSTVADVTRALVGYLGLAAPSSARSDGDRSDSDGRRWCLYRQRGAHLLTAAAPWAEADLCRGDAVVLGPVTGTRPPAPRSAAGSERTPARWRVLRRALPGATAPVTPHPVETPPAPEPVTWRGRGIVWQIAGGLGMVGVGIGMAFVNPAFLLLALLGGVATLWGIVAGLFGERSRGKRALLTFRTRLAELDAELTAVRAHQAERLHQTMPPVERCAGWPARGARALWQRRPGDPDFLALRLGSGTRPALLAVDSFALRSTSPLAAEVTALLDRHRELIGAPVSTPPGLSGVLGVTGEAAPATAAARSLVVQATALHSPAVLPLAVLATDDTESWTRWLPHVEGPDGPRAAYTAADVDDLATRLLPLLTPDKYGSLAASPRMLLLVDAGAAARPPVRALLDAATAGTALAVVLGPRERLPSTTAILVDCRGDRARLLGAAGSSEPFTLEGLDVHRAAAFAQQLAPWTDAEQSGPDAKRTVAPGTGLLALLGIGDPSRVDPDEHWTVEPPVPFGTPVGVTDAGDVLELSLMDGPHGLIAGTTGSGKSEFLQSFLAGLAATHSPERITFFLVDFKGGATFTELARLPHVVGMVTNLAGALAERAVTSLKAELTRRQTVLAAARVKEFPDYRADPAAGRPPLPRLLLVIDEFAMLAAELPDVMDRFVDIATVGRSLGVHMLLATQSPSGVVSGKVEANTNLRICLRVALAQESIDVLGRKDAADIPRGKPGRGFLRFGGETELTGFQTARIAGPWRRTASGAAPVQVAPFADARPSVARTGRDPVAAESGRTELDVLTDTLAEQAIARGMSAPRALWLPPLPEVLTPAALEPLPARDAGRSRGADLRIRLGLSDEPEQVAQPLLTVDLGADGHLLVVGAYGTGKTSTLRHVAVELAGRIGPDRLHLYGIDAGDDSLSPLLALPQTADVVGAQDLERLLPLFSRLEKVVAERRADAGAGVERPSIVLFLDDVAAFRETSDAFQYGVLLDRLVSLLRSGPSVDVHVVLSAAQRTDLPSSIFNLFARKVLLRQTDPLDYDLIGVPPSARPAAAAPGRSMVSGPPPREVQVAFTDRAAVEALAGVADADQRPARIPRLPRELPLADLLPQANPDGFVLGRGGPEALPVVHDTERDGPNLMVAGGERSGRSTTLLTAAAALRATRPDLPVTVLAPRRSPVRALGDEDGVTLATTPEQAQLALNDLTMRPPGAALLLVDDLEALGDAVLLALEPVLRGARESGLIAVVAGRSADLARSFDPATRYLRSLRSTLLLMPRPEDGELIGTHIPPATGAIVPGRGLLYSGTGEPVRLQVARPD